MAVGQLPADRQGLLEPLDGLLVPAQQVQHRSAAAQGYWRPARRPCSRAPRSRVPTPAGAGSQPSGARRAPAPGSAGRRPRRARPGCPPTPAGCRQQQRRQDNARPPGGHRHEDAVVPHLQRAEDLERGASPDHLEFGAQQRRQQHPHSPGGHGDLRTEVPHPQRPPGLRTSCPPDPPPNCHGRDWSRTAFARRRDSSMRSSASVAPTPSCAGIASVRNRTASTARPAAR